MLEEKDPTTTSSAGDAPKAATPGEINLFDYLEVVYRYRAWIIVLCIAAMGVTGTLSLTSPITYEASASIVPPWDVSQRESDVTGRLGAGQRSLLSRAMGVASIADMYVGILESRAVVDAIVDRFNLMQVYGDAANRTAARNKLKDNTTTKVSAEGIVRIAVRDHDPNMAAGIANAYVEELDKRNKTLSAGQATSKRIFLENRLAEIEQKLSKFEDILSREAKVQNMLYELLSQEYELAKMEEAKSMPTIQVLDQALVPETRMGRGTVRKTMLAGVAAFVLGVISAFALDYRAKFRRVKAARSASPVPDLCDADTEGASLDGIESHRRAISSLRRKRPREDQTYSQRT